MRFFIFLKKQLLEEDEEDVGVDELRLIPVNDFVFLTLADEGEMMMMMMIM